MFSSENRGLKVAWNGYWEEVIYYYYYFKFLWLELVKSQASLVVNGAQTIVLLGLRVASWIEKLHRLDNILVFVFVPDSMVFRT